MKTTESAPPSPCRSVFREGTENVTKEKYTQLWVTLINQLECSKQTLTGAR